MQADVQQPLYGGDFETDSVGPIPFVLQGERVDLTPDGLTLLTPSPDRVAATHAQAHCVHFGICGGCQYQHASYPAQLNLKQQILTGLLEQAGLRNLPAIERLSGPEWRYRNRIRLRVMEVERSLQAGYSRRASNEFLPIRMCPIAAPLLWRAAQAILQAGAGDTLAARWLRAVAEVELFTTGDESRLQMLFLLRDPITARQTRGGFAAACKELAAALPELAGAGADLDPELSRRLRRDWQAEAWGAAGLIYPVGATSHWVTHWVSRGAFFQVNRFLVGSFVELVTQSPTEEPRHLAWDLFAGVGLFSRVLAGTFARVVAVEGGEIASSDLAQAARGGKGGPAFESRRSATLDFLRGERLQRERPDLVVLDPPRAGLGTEAAALLAEIQPQRLVYVSCDPVTLARDLAVLTRTYRIERLTLVDMFPQTFHLETVVHLRLV